MSKSSIATKIQSVKLRAFTHVDIRFRLTSVWVLVVLSDFAMRWRLRSVVCWHLAAFLVIMLVVFTPNIWRYLPEYLFDVPRCSFWGRVPVI